MKLLFFALFILTSITCLGQQLPSQVQAKRGVFTERLFLKDRWIDKISTDLNSSDSASDNVLATGKAIADYIKRNSIHNQDSVVQPANLWITGKAVVGSLQVDSPDVKFNTLGEWGDVLVGADNNGILKKITLGNNLYLDNGTLHAITSQSNEPYWKYIALLSQTGTNNPIANALENNMGDNIIWTRNSAGNYTGTFPYGFARGFTWIRTEASDETGNTLFTRLYWTSSSTLTLIVKDANLVNTDNWTNISVEIRVYIQD
jgi:hypothetical protein